MELQVSIYLKFLCGEARKDEIEDAHRIDLCYDVIVITCQDVVNLDNSDTPS